MTTSRTVESTDHPGVTVPTAIRAWSRWRWVRPSRWVLASIVLAGALLLGALVGPAGLTARSVLLELVGALPGVHVDSGLTAQQQAILWQIRLPRVVPSPRAPISRASTVQEPISMKRAKIQRTCAAASSSWLQSNW